MAFDVKTFVWTERYRPSTVDGVVGDFRDKIKSYLKDPMSIPNFLFYSKAAGSGKCVVKDEMFLIDDGLMSFEEYNKKENIVDEITDKQISVLDIDNKFVQSSYIYKGRGQVLQIRTKNGFDLSGTYEHKIRIFDINDGIIWKKLSDIKLGDLAIVKFNTNIFGTASLNYKKYNERIINFKEEYKHATNLKDIRTPVSINEDIAFLLGVIVANGSRYNNATTISTYKKELQEKIVNIARKEFNCLASSIHEKRKNNRIVGCSINSKEFIYFLDCVCGYEHNTARYKKIPKIIFEVSKEMQISFLNGLFEDAYYNKMDSINYYTASEKLAKEIQLLLANMGFVASRKQKHIKGYDHNYWNINICVEHSQKLIKLFDGAFKNIKIKESLLERNTNMLGYGLTIMKYVLNKRKEKHITKHMLYQIRALQSKKIHKGMYAVKKDIIKLIHDEPYLHELAIFLNNDLLLEPITNILDVGEKDVYDFHIPGTHSFITSGFISHNTSLAKAIIKDLGCDALIINSSDDRNIETIRDRVKQFAMTMGTKEGIKRCIFLDEADGLTKVSMEALRNIFETYASNVFFILTCNRIESIIEPIRSRCIEISFSYPKKEETIEYLKMICVTENMKFTEEGISALVDKNYPSIRNMVLVLQDLHNENKEVVPENVKSQNAIYEELWQKLKEKDWRAIKDNILSTTIDARELNSFFWECALKEESIKMIQLCCRNERDMSFGSDAKIVVISSLLEMVK